MTVVGQNYWNKESWPPWINKDKLGSFVVSSMHYFRCIHIQSPNQKAYGRPLFTYSSLMPRKSHSWGANMLSSCSSEAPLSKKDKRLPSCSPPSISILLTILIFLESLSTSSFDLTLFLPLGHFWCWLDIFSWCFFCHPYVLDVPCKALEFDKGWHPFVIF